MVYQHLAMVLCKIKWFTSICTVFRGVSRALVAQICLATGEILGVLVCHDCLEIKNCQYSMTLHLYGRISIIVSGDFPLVTIEN